MREVSIHDIKDNMIDMISKEWMLVAAGDESGYNMMTASWGMMGEMWNKDVAITVIRPQRYTKKFVDENELFTLSFYGDNKAVHAVCGKMSGKDVDKTALAGLHPVFTDGTVTFEEARLTLVCRKIYEQEIDKDCFVDKSLLANYENGDYHVAYIGEIVKVLVND